MLTNQAESEADTFVYNFLTHVDTQIAESYRNEAFNKNQSQQNLKKFLSTVPNNFLNTLISTKSPKTNYPSLIFNPKKFNRNKINQQFPIPKKKRLELILKHITKIAITHRIIGHTRSVRLICHDPARQFFLTVSCDRTMKLWHLGSLSLMYTYKGHEDDVINAELSPDRSLIASISNDQSIRLWSLMNGRCLDRIIDNALWPFHCATFSPCSKFLAIASEHGRIIIRCVNDIDPIALPQRHTKAPVLKTIILRDPVRHCCFSPGGRLIAAALHSGNLAVFTVFDSSLWTANVCDGHCDFCFFHPFVPSQVFAFSSKLGIATQWEIGDKLTHIRTFNAKQVFKRMQSCLFALSCDASLMFACSSTQIISWYVADGKTVSKIENLPTAAEVSPHPQIPIIVAIVCRNVVLIINIETEAIINSMYIPDATWKLHSGNWSENGLEFYAADSAGGVYVFRQGKDREPTCSTSFYFFPNDFTDSYWDPSLGEVEDLNKQHVHLNPRDKLLSDTGKEILSNYRPHNFEDIFCLYSQHPSISAFQDYEDRWLSKLNSSETIECETDIIVTESQAIMANAEEPEAVSSSESSNEDEIEDSAKPQDRYPFWTTVDSVTHNTYFPQIGDRVVYFREGHLQMVRDDPTLSNTITPLLENEIWWPSISAFVIQEVHHGKFACSVAMKRLQLPSRGRNNFVKDVENCDQLEVVQDEPTRTFEYPIGNAPPFMILAEQFCTYVEAFDKMAIGDDVDIYFKKGDSEKKYSGRILRKIDTNTWYNSIEIDWGDDNSDDSKYSPWEIFAINKHEVYSPSPLSRELETQCKAVKKVLNAAQKSVRSLRPFFKQPFFVHTIVYPSDFGLVSRRIMNNMYRNLISLKFDITSVLDTQAMLPKANDRDISCVQLLVERLNNVLDDPSAVDDYCDFSHFEEEAEDLQDQKERQRIAKEREARGKKKVYVGLDDDSDDENDIFNADDEDDMPYEDIVVRRSNISPMRQCLPRLKKKSPSDYDDDEFNDDDGGEMDEEDDFAVPKNNGGFGVSTESHVSSRNRNVNNNNSKYFTRSSVNSRDSGPKREQQETVSLSRRRTRLRANKKHIDESSFDEGENNDDNSPYGDDGADL